MHTNITGDASAAYIVAALIKSGASVLLPFSDHQRYDLAIEQNGTFNRIQCKTGRLKNGAIKVRMFSVTCRGKKHTTYDGDVDAFGVYCPENRKVYLIPMDRIHYQQKQVMLRIDPPLNGQSKGVHWAKDFEIYDPIV